MSFHVALKTGKNPSDFPVPKSDFGLLCKPPVVEPPFQEDEDGGSEG